MGEQRKALMLRVEQSTYDALVRWATSEMRSINNAAEYLLRKALVDQLDEQPHVSVRP